MRWQFIPVHSNHKHAIHQRHFHVNMSLSLPGILTSEALNFGPFPSALVPGVYIKYTEGDRSQNASLSSIKKYALIQNITSSTAITTSLLKVPRELSTQVQAQIPPLRYFTTRYVPEIVQTQETTTISSSQVSNLIYVFNIEDIQSGALPILGMADYYLCRFTLTHTTTNNILPITTFASFPS